VSGAKCRKAADSIDDNGIFDDIAVMSASGSMATRHEDKTRDVNAFLTRRSL
jgi:hypothetical protein